MIKKLLSHTFIYAFFPRIPQFASIFILPLITPYLSSFDYGVFGVVMAYTAGFSAFQNLGLHVILVNSYYKYPTKYKFIWREIHGFLISWSIPFSIILGVILYYIIPKEVTGNRMLIVFFNCFPVILFQNLQLIASRYYQMEQKPLPISVRSLITSLIAIGMNFYTIKYLRMGYMGWFLSNFIVSLITYLSYLYPIYRHGLMPVFTFKIRRIKNYLKVALPLVPHYYSSYLLNASDRVVMNIYNININQIGIYNVANNFSGYFAQFADSLGFASNPLFLKHYSNGNYYSARNLIFNIQAILLITTFLFCLWSKEVFILLIKNKELHSAYPISIILVMAYSYRGLYLGCSSILFYHEKTKIMWKITLIAGVLNVFLNVIFVPYYGITASAIITFISFLYMGYIGFALKEYRKTTPINFYPVYWLAITFLSSVTVFFLKDIHFQIKIIITIALSLFVLFYIKRNKQLFI